MDTKKIIELCNKIEIASKNLREAEEMLMYATLETRHQKTINIAIGVGQAVSHYCIAGLNSSNCNSEVLYGREDEHKMVLRLLRETVNSKNKLLNELERTLAIEANK